MEISIYCIINIPLWSNEQHSGLPLKLSTRQLYFSKRFYTALCEIAIEHVVVAGHMQMLTFHPMDLPIWHACDMMTLVHVKSCCRRLCAVFAQALLNHTHTHTHTHTHVIRGDIKVAMGTWVVTRLSAITTTQTFCCRVPLPSGRKVSQPAPCQLHVK